MKRIYIYLTVMATLLIGGGKAMAQSVTIDGVTYTVSGSYAKVTGFNQSVIDVVVQGSVNIGGTDYTVTEIGANAFKDCSSITSLVLPESLTTISSCAFYDCISLKELRIPSNVTAIGWNAMVGLKSVTLIELKFTDITSNMEILFSNMDGRHIDLICHSKTVPDMLCTASYSPNSHGGGGYVPTTTTLYVPKECYNAYKAKYPNHTIMGLSDIGKESVTENGIRYIGNEAVEVIDKTLTEYTIKEGTTTLGVDLFADCANLTNIIIPSSVTSIGANAFSGCTSLPIENGIRYADDCAVEVVDKSLIEYTLKDGVRFLGSRLFDNCTKMTSINIPSSVIEIGDYAFSNCKSLSSIVLPEGLVSLGDCAFYYCTALTSIEIPAGITSINNGAFNECQFLSSISLPSGLKTIGVLAFKNCKSLASVTLPDGVTYIGSSAFQLCSSLVSLEIPAVLETINSSAFQGCSSLTTVTLSEGLLRIENNAFSNCTKLETINIPNSVTYISNSAFSVCTSLPLETGIRYIGTRMYELVDRNLAEYIIKDGTESIPANFFSNCTNMTSITIPSSVISVGENAFNGCTSLPIEGGIRYADCCAVAVTNKNLEEYKLKDNVRFLGSELFKDCSAMKSVNIPSGVSSIGANTFNGCSSLTSLTLPDGVTSIGGSAFINCSSLTSVNIPSGVPSIGDNTFYGCTSLTSLTLPDGVTSIGGSAFYNCSSLTSVNIPSGVPSIGDNTFSGCSALTSLTLPESVTSIGGSAFYNCSSLTSLILPDGVTSIGGSAFSGCSALTSLTLPESVTSIGGSAFANCSSLTSVNIPSGVPSIGDNTFSGCSALTSLTLPESVTSIGGSAFAYCSSLTSLTLPESVTSIGNHAFYLCTSLTSINIPSGVSAIGEYTFFRCSSLTSMTLPASVTSIGNQAFYNCGELTTLTLSKKLTSIGTQAFQYCNKLQKIINYSDLQLTKGNTGYGYVAAYAQQIINADAIIDDYYYFDTDSNGKHHLTYYEGTDSVLVLPSDYQGENYCIDDAVFSGHSEIVSIQLPDEVESIGANTFNGCSSLTSLTLPESVTSIGSSAFYNCSSLTSVIIPEGLTSIGDNTFYGCSSLTSLTLPESVTSIGAEAFYGCSSLTSLTLPESVTSIGAEAFYDCSSLASVNIPSGVSKIDTRTFYGCAALSSMTIPASVTSIGNQAFVGCTGIKDLTLADGRKTLSLDQNGYGSYTGQFTPCSKLETLYLGRNLNYNTDGYYGGYSPFYNIPTLKEVVVGDSVTAIGINAFHSCGNLTSISLPASVTSIGSSAFYSCGNLTSISLPASVTSIGSSAFSGCGSLTYVRCGFESPQVLYGKDLREKAVIYVPKGTYVAFKETFPNNIIVDGEANEVTVDITIPGTLGEEVLNQVAYLRDVHSLKVSGTLNNDDISTITGSMVNLLHLDLSKTSLASVNGIGHANLCSIVFPDSCKSLSGYSERDNLTSIILPDAVETLGDNCFYGCDQLTEVTMPANLKTVGAYAFRYCRKLKEITFKDGLVLVGNEAFYDCSNLKSVFFGAGDKTIGHQAFWNCNSLESVSFGDGVASITGSHPFYSCDKLRILIVGDGISTSTNDSNYPAFRECYNISEIHIPNIEAWLNSSFSNIQSTPNYVSSNVNLYIDGELLTDVVIPSSVTSIRPYAFASIKGITSVTIPENVTSIGDKVFSGCTGLKEVTMSEGIKTIPSEAFYACCNLASVVIPEGVTTIQGNAFAECDSLRSITLPSTLNKCAAGAFTGSGLEEVTCPAFFPPVTGGDLIGANNCTLYVPEWTLNRYKLANNWNFFAAIEPISGIYPSTISIYTEESLAIPAEGLAEDYTPNMELVRYDANNVGRLTLRGEKALPLSTFKMEQTRDVATMTSLVNHGTLTADSVVTQLSISTNTWHYLTFPYDVKISDIATLGDWVIRRYDGASRARADFSSTWQNVPYDSILHAGEGYIWYSTNGNFTVPAIKNDNRNLIFANDARYTQLKEHASATEANYGWNLIGNPYPCFYDTRFIEYGSPITVRSGNSYAAYSPVDDSYILSPLEAFFVQCSADNNVVAFDAEGRQNDKTVRTLTSAPKRTRAVSNDRSVFNLYLENGSYADHTRFVINESASLAYEIACDAAKFMSDDPAVQQLFTIEGEERMAINERPFANGEVALGTYFGKSGSYTIALDTRVTEMEVVLVDKFTGAETDLMTDSYTFTTEAGTFTDRFAIRMKRTGVVDAIEAATAAKVQVTALSGAISIMNAATPVSIYNAAGALVTTMDGGDVTVEVAPGMYIVKVGDEIHKVSVIK